MNSEAAMRNLRGGLFLISLVFALTLIVSLTSFALAGGGGGGGGGSTSTVTSGTTTIVVESSSVENKYVGINPNGKYCVGTDVPYTLFINPGYSYSSYYIYNLVIENSDPCPSSGYIRSTTGSVTCAAGQECVKAVCFYYSSPTSYGIGKSEPFVLDKKQPVTEIVPGFEMCAGEDLNFNLYCSDSACGCAESYYKIIDTFQTCGTTGFTNGSVGTITCPAGQVCQKKVCYYSVDVAGNKEAVKQSPIFTVDKINSDFPCFQCPDGTKKHEFYGDAFGYAIKFYNGGGVNNSAKISIPRFMNITKAYLNVSGECITEVTEKDFDSVVVTDVSGSMSGTKLTEAKAADKAYVSEVTKNPTNLVGLVSFESTVDSFLSLTSSVSALNAEIDSYTDSGCTCISCGVVKATDIAIASSKAEKYMIVMSDGVANTVIGGSGCGASSTTAKAQAVDKARIAWETYGIRVFTVGYGSDVDELTLQQMAAAGNGLYYFADSFNVSQVYQQIALDISRTCPTNPSVNVGAEGPVEWSYNGSFETTETVPDFAAALRDLIPSCSCSGCSISGSDCIIDLQTYSESAGYMVLSGLHISYKSTAEANCSNGIDEDCDQLIDRADPDCWACGNNYVDTNETCELPGDLNDQLCPQNAQECSGNKLGQRDAYGDCGQSCGCVADPFTYSCVQGSCGATCDEVTDSNVAGSTCFYGCDTERSCSYQSNCSMQSYCSNNVYFYGASCTNIGCVFQQTDCNSLDRYDDYVYYCQGDTIRRHRLFHDYSCSPSGCTESTSWVDDSQVDDCSSRNGSITGQCGENAWTCQVGTLPGSQPQCVIKSTQPNNLLCQPLCNDSVRLYNGICGPGYVCQYQQENCLNYNGDYCVGNSVERRSYSCSPLTCTYSVVNTTSCGTDGWFGTGNVPGNNDTACEYRDYYCQDSGLNDYCTFGVNETHDYDNLDGTYCVSSGESVETRDYYCGLTGQSSYTVTVPRADCGQEYWSGGEDTQGFGNDPSCQYTDYYCVDSGVSDYCNSSIAYTDDFDYLDNTGDLCDAFKTFQIDYYCKLSTCNSTIPSEGCDHGKNIYGLGCSIDVCGAECQTDQDCEPNTCQVTYNDSCSGLKLVDYNGDKALNSLLVSDSDPTYCLDSCSCTEGAADCSPPQPQSYCVQGVCGAKCDASSDYSVETQTCRYGCDPTSSCDYQSQCSLVSYCSGQVYNYGGQCTSTGCTFQTQNCDSLDYYDNYTFYCQSDGVRKHRMFHDFSCSPTGCTESTRWTDDQLVQDCNLQDGSVSGDCGIQDWGCTETGGAKCAVKSTIKSNVFCQNACDGNVREYNGYCGDDFLCHYQTEDCSALTGKYCDGNSVVRKDYYCTPSSCQYQTTTLETCVQDGWYNHGNVDGSNDPACEFRDGYCQDSGLNDFCTFGVTETHDYDNMDGSYCTNGNGAVESRDYYCNATGQAAYQATPIETCIQDGWYNYGNVVGNDDPACELRDGYCLDSGLNDRCTYSVTETHDYDNMDGSYCVSGNEALEQRDYYCNATGQTVYQASGYSDCGQEYWSGGGNTQGFGNDPACEYKDFYCVDKGLNDYCNSSITYTEDFDYLDNNDSDACLESKLIPVDYWCNLPTCDSVNPVNGCDPSKTLLDFGCNAPICGAECENDDDCPDSSCQQTYTDYCSGAKLVEFDSDKIKDSTTVSDSEPNTCLGSCSCTENQAYCPVPSTNTYCVAEVCGAVCDSANDHEVSGSTCYFGCNYNTTCSYSGSSPMSNYCSAGVRYYGAECTSTGVTFRSENCDSLDYYGPWESYCSNGKVYRRRMFHDFSCSPSGCTESTSWSSPELVQDCMTNDGSSRNECGVEHWNCVASSQTQASCVVEVTKDQTKCTNFCEGDVRNFGSVCSDTYYCTPYQTEDCNALDERYCIDGNTVGFYDYQCQPQACVKQTGANEKCQTDSWFNFGNVAGGNDPACEFRDFMCVDDGKNDHCIYNVTSVNDYDNFDGSYCMNNNRALETRDYYCNATGQATYNVTAQPTDCGQESWAGGGNTQGFGDDPACLFTDYYCVDNGYSDYCTSSSTQSWDFDYMDDPFSCSDNKLGKLDYWCVPQTCDPITPANGCDYANQYYDLQCSQACGGECSSGADCPAYLLGDQCYYGSSCASTCMCQYLQEYCPLPGTVNDGVCYFGMQQCDQSGCTLDSCILIPGQSCDPDAGCLTCQDIGVISTTFSDGSFEKELWFPTGGGHNASAAVKLPRNIVVTGSSLKVSGMPTYMTSEKKIDAVLVTDVSGSMTGDKITQAKAADLEFVNLILGTDGNINQIGLVSFSTTLETYLPLTNSIQSLESHINAYKPESLTCISCGIIKATDLLKIGGNGNRVMVVMSDGMDNQAPGRVVPKAKEAWDLYGIRVFTVAFGEDADRTTLEAAATAGHGKFYVADTDSIVRIYREIAIDVTQSYAINPAVEVNGDMPAEWSFAGDFDNGTATFSFTDAINDVLSACSCPYCSVSGSDCIVGLDTSSTTASGLLLSDLSVQACSYHPEQNIVCSKCSDCGGGEDCVAYGAWSEFECSWDGVCDQQATCSRDRDVITYTCNIPGTINSYCTDSQNAQHETAAQNRVTEGQACDDSLYCTVYDQCASGFCQGSQRTCNDNNPCTDDTCNEQADACTAVNDNTNVCGQDRTCPESGCIGQYWTVYPPSGHDYCSAGTCMTHSCMATNSYYSQDCVGVTDSDSDGIADAQDNCPTTYNPSQANNDQDSMGDACDNDDDNDGILDSQDNCPLLSNPTQSNNDQDSMGDACDNDDDNDGTLDINDLCAMQSGNACNGCANPCTGCAVMICQAGLQPTCQANNAACMPTTCPQDGCGLGSCEAFEKANYPDYIDNTCSLVGTVGTCSQNTCSALETCTPAVECGYQNGNDTVVNATLLFTEVAYDTIPSTNEWVELYNPGNASVNVSGWTIEDNSASYSIPQGTVIQPGETIVISRDLASFYAQFNKVPDFSDFNLALNNNGDMLTLRDGTREIDMVAWESFVSGWNIYASTGKSLQRSPMWKDTDTSADWIGNQVPNPEPFKETKHFTFELSVPAYVEPGMNATISGRLLNVTGDPVQGNVLVSFSGPGQILNGTSNANQNGTFSMVFQIQDSLDLGNYTVTATYDGEQETKPFTIVDCVDCDGDGFAIPNDCDDTSVSTNPAAVETCNNKDDNCDGKVDDFTEVCGSSTGRCETGTKTCTAGVWGSCVGSIGPITETCNSVDDDCDGSVDEGACGSSSGGGGGGGGGGSYSSSSVKTCTPDWKCTDWSACASGQQTRTCTDQKKCSTSTGKPAETQECTVPVVGNLCQPYEVKCDGSDVLNCAPEGDHWVIMRTCDIACLDGRCVDTLEFNITSNVTGNVTTTEEGLTGRFLTPTQTIAAIVIVLLVVGALIIIKILR